MRYFRQRHGRRCAQYFLDFNPRVADVSKTPVFIFLEAAPQQVSHGGGHRRSQRLPVWLTLENSSDRVGQRVSLKRMPARQQLIQHAAKRPDVGLLVDRFTPHLLGAHVARRS